MSNMNDVVDGANLFGGSSYSFTYDRFCSAKSAIYFNQGYLQVPPGVYFTGDFTVTAWIYLKSYQSYSTIFEFANLKSNGIQGFIYVNGIQMVQYKTNFLSVPIQINRTNNYFGKGNWYNLNADAIYDEIKIYQVALTPIQIINEYNISSSYSKF